MQIDSTPFSRAEELAIVRRDRLALILAGDRTSALRLLLDGRLQQLNHNT